MNRDALVHAGVGPRKNDTPSLSLAVPNPPLFPSNHPSCPASAPFSLLMAPPLPLVIVISMRCASAGQTCGLRVLARPPTSPLDVLGDPAIPSTKPLNLGRPGYPFN